MTSQAQHGGSGVPERLDVMGIVLHHCKINICETLKETGANVNVGQRTSLRSGVLNIMVMSVIDDERSAMKALRASWYVGGDGWWGRCYVLSTGKDAGTRKGVSAKVVFM